MSVFGKQTANAQNDDVFAGFKYVSKYTLVDTADVSKITVDMDGKGSLASAGSATIRGVIYADNGGEPGALVASTPSANDVVLSHTGAGAGTARANFDIAFTTHPQLLPGDYWIGFVVVSGNSQAAQMWGSFASGHGRTKSGGVTDPFGTPTTTINEDIGVNATYTAITTVRVSSTRTLQYTVFGVPPVISSPADGATISAKQLISMTIVGQPHHVQLEYSLDGGTTWKRLSAKNCRAPWEHNMNTWRFGNGTIKIRARQYSGSHESSLTGTSAVMTYTISNAAGTVRDYVGGVDTIAAAIAAASNGDTIRLTGTFPNETSDGGTIHMNKRVKIIKHPSAPSRPSVRTRIIWDADAYYCEDIEIFVAPTTGGIFSEGNTNSTAGAFKRCRFTNNGSVKNVGMVDGLEYIFGNQSVDMIYDECEFDHAGSWTDNVYSLFHIHGIYLQNSRRAFLNQPKGWHNTSRQFQLGPNCQECTVYKPLGYESRHGVAFYSDTGMGNDTTLSSALNNGDTVANLTDGSTYGQEGYLILGTEFIKFVSRSGNVVTLASSVHGSYSSGATVKLYTVSDYNTVELGLIGHTGNDGAGNRSSSDGIIFASNRPGNGSASTPRPIRNEVLDTFLFEPATSGTVPQPPDSNAYLDMRSGSETGFEGGGFSDAGGNVLGGTPGFADAASFNFQLDVGDAAVGYGPDSIQPATASVSSTATLQYNVASRVAATRQLLYGLGGRVQSSRQLLYKVIARINSQRTLRYKLGLVELTGLAGDPTYDNLSPVAKIIVDKMWPLMHSSPYNLDLATLIQGESIMLDSIDAYVRDGENGEPGWSVLVDVDRAPSEGLPWLSQFAGVRLPSKSPFESQEDFDASARVIIKEQGGQRRGRPAAIISAAQTYLTGNKSVVLHERAGGNAWHLVVVTFTTETPEPDLVEAAIRNTQKPGGIIMTYNVIDGQDYQILLDHMDDYQDAFTTYATYEGVVRNVPGT
jgi:hypothetical protein